MDFFVCIAENGGISFGGRRVSRDKNILEDALRTRPDLRAFSETAKMFTRAGLKVSEITDLAGAPENAAVFLEADPAPFASLASRVILYRFNRDYPADVFMTLDLSANGFRLASSAEFAGLSHEKITKEVYEK